MRRALAAVFVTALTLALALPATAATPSPQRMAAQIRTLQNQVKGLQRTVKTLKTQANGAQSLALISLLYGACNTAATADALQAANPAFGTTPVTDYSVVTRNGTSCGDLGRVAGASIARQPNTATVNVFQSLLNIFRPS
jgi:hypothetical protein